MEDGDTEKNHVSSLIQDVVFSSRKMGCIRCISSQVHVYNKIKYHTSCFFLFGLMLNFPVNSYGHVRMVSLPCYTFS